MGLLSNPKQRQKIIDAVSRYNNMLCVLCYVVGVAWFLALASPYLNAQTYISENALLPGVVGNEFHFADFDVDAVLKELQEELKKDKGYPTPPSEDQSNVTLQDTSIGEITTFKTLFPKYNQLIAAMNGIYTGV